MAKAQESIDVVKELLNKTEKEIQNMQPVNILVAGKTGVGKSTLINNVFRESLADTGVGKPITQHLRKITKEGIPLALYDTRGLELEEKIQRQITSEIFKLIEQNEGTPDQVHVAYYCIQANSSRIEDSEIELISTLAKKIPVILVLTQAIGQPAKDFEAYLENLNLDVKFIQRVMAEPYQIDEEITLPEYGLKELIEKTFEIIPKDTYDAFLNVQQADIDRKAKAARKWASRYVTSTFGVGFAPIPFADSSVLVPMQLTMMAHITAIFGISLERSTLVSIISAVGGTGGATLVGKSVVSNALKLIPGVGTVVGGVISGTTAAVITSALAYSYIEVLTLVAMGQKLGDEVQPSQIKELMKERYAKNLLKGKEQIDTDKLEMTKNHQEESPVGQGETENKGRLSKTWRALKKVGNKYNPLKKESD